MNAWEGKANRVPNTGGRRGQGGIWEAAQEMTFGLSFAVNTGASHKGEGQCAGSAQGHGAQTELGHRVTVASV